MLSIQVITLLNIVCDKLCIIRILVLDINYRYKFDLDMYNNCTSERKLINDHNLSYDQLAIVSNLSTLFDIRSGNCYIYIYIYIYMGSQLMI